MRLSRLYIDSPLAGQGILTLPPDSSHYLGKVLRLKPLQEIVLFNGDGIEYRALILSVTKQAVTVEMTSQHKGQAPSPLHTHIGQVISRGDRMDYAIQKACEMGVTEITPLFSQRCEVKLAGDRLPKRHQHWQQVAIHASEQSGRNQPAIVHAPMSLLPWVQASQSDCRWVMHPHLDVQLNPPNEQPWTQPITPASCAVLIGPEGGFTNDEVAQAIVAGFQTMTLGPRVLRTETAPVAALAVLQTLWGDWRLC